MNTTSSNTPDWAAVKAYYPTCRSYKQTAEQFGLKIATLNARAYREKWAACNAECNVDAIREHPMESRGHENVTPDVPSEVADNAKCNVGCNVGCNVDNAGCNVNAMSEHPLNTESVQDEHPLNTEKQLPVPSAAPSFLLPTLKNFASQEVQFRTPWEVHVRPRSSFANKAALKAHLSSPAAEDCIFSGIRGQSANLRVGRDNPPAALLAVVADYDKPLTSKERQKKLDRLVHRPSFICTSFSGGTHAVWLLESPLPLMPDRNMVNNLLQIIAKELKLNTAFGTLDAKAFYTPGQYYHVGWDWQATDDTPLSESMTALWFDAALQKSRFTESGVQIPLSCIETEMQKRFPNRWQGEFALGARGIRFWDAQADNPTAAVVAENGMICYTGPFAFRSWEDIFGHEFIERYRAETEGLMLSECYFVDNSFYVRTDYRGADGVLRPAWQQLNRQSMESFAAMRYNLSSAPVQEGQPSPLRQAISRIIVENSLAAAGPMIYRKDKIVMVNEEPRLNTSFLRVMEPDPAKGAFWGDGFPWVAAFLEGLFPDVIQRERFIAEWSYAYRNAYIGTPKNGHTLFIAGPAGVGKNFLSECLFGTSFGGFADASEYLLGRTRFNANLVGVGVWTCNDTVIKGDAKERAIFAKALKKMAANQVHVVEAKFRNASSVPWEGRVLVTLNTDPLSLQLLPDVEISNRDKISLFKTSDKVLDDKRAVQHAQDELPALCNYLLNMDIPEHCRGDARWGVRNYLHDDLYAEAANSSSTASLGEILTLFAQDMFSADRRRDVIEGSATWFLQQMLLQDGIKEMLRSEVSARSIGKQMSALASAGAFPLRYHRKATQRVWSIERAAFEDYCQNGMQEGGTDELCPF